MRDERRTENNPSFYLLQYSLGVSIKPVFLLHFKMIAAKRRKQSNQRYRKFCQIAWSLLMIWIGYLLHAIVSFNFSSPSMEQRVEGSSLEMMVDSSKNGQVPIYAEKTAKRPPFEIMLEPTNNKHPTTSAEKKHWCIIASKYLPATTRNHFHHFPHASEILLPCWSYFMEQHATGNCGFWIASSLFELTAWPKELIEKMGCDVKYADEQGQGIDNNGFVAELPTDDIQHIPNLYLLRPRLEYIQYLNKPSHAHALRKLFVDEEFINSKKGNGKPLQIGMIQREASRKIRNFDELKDGIQRAIPNADIICTNFKFNTVKEQAEWFATKDVVVAAHGAALTNAIFITEGTIVMQLYPPKYFWQSLDPLIEQSGGHAIQWYQKGTNPATESALLPREEFDEAGKGTFIVAVDEVVKPLLYTLEIEVPTNMKLKKLYGHYI